MTDGSPDSSQKLANPAKTGDSANPASSVQERAQAAAIVVGVVTILVGSDPLDVRGSSNTYRVLDYLLIALWLVVLLIFLFAHVSGPKANGERRLKVALGSSAFAVAMTVALLALTGLGISTDYDKVLVEVKTPEMTTLTRLCQDRPAQRLQLYGRVQTSRLDTNIVVVKLDQTLANSTCDEVKLSRDEIVAFVEHPCNVANGVNIASSAFCPGARWMIVSRVWNAVSRSISTSIHSLSPG